MILLVLAQYPSFWVVSLEVEWGFGKSPNQNDVSTYLFVFSLFIEV